MHPTILFGFPHGVGIIIQTIGHLGNLGIGTVIMDIIPTDIIIIMAIIATVIIIEIQ
jgi:hypothetical protein